MKKVDFKTYESSPPNFSQGIMSEKLPTIGDNVINVIPIAPLVIAINNNCLNDILKIDLVGTFSRIHYPRFHPFQNQHSLQLDALHSILVVCFNLTFNQFTLLFDIVLSSIPSLGVLIISSTPPTI